MIAESLGRAVTLTIYSGLIIAICLGALVTYLVIPSTKEIEVRKKIEDPDSYRLEVNDTGGIDTIYIYKIK